jgi:hypothetical protein
MNETETEQPEQLIEPEPQPEQTGSITDILNQVDGALKNPVIVGMVKSHAAEVKEMIEDYSGNYKTIVYGYLKSNYPDVHESLSNVPEQEETKDVRSSMIPAEQFKNDVLDLYEQGYNYSQIATILSEENKKDIYPMQISRIIKKAEDKKDDKSEQDKPKPKSEVIASIANEVARRIPASAKPVPAPMPAPMFKIPDVDGMYSNIISTLRWSAVAILTGILGFILGKVIH